MGETLLITSDVVITVDEQDRIYEDGAIAVEDGKIVEIGRR